MIQLDEQQVHHILNVESLAPHNRFRLKGKAINQKGTVTKTAWEMVVYNYITTVILLIKCYLYKNVQ